LLAEQMLAEATAEMREEVLKEVARCRAFAEGLDEGARAARDALPRNQIRLAAHWSRAERQCPACMSGAELIGYLVRELPPQLKDDEVIQHSLFLPIRILCNVCDLDLKEHERLMIAGVGDTFTEMWSTDPEEYFGIGFEERYDQYEYGND
jgi:hypothetical protein